MAVNSTHPQYDKYSQVWVMLRDVSQGEAVVKSKTTQYLPATPSMNIDGMQANQLGYNIYLGYLSRAVFHEYFAEGVRTLLGMMHHKPPTIELPAVMEPLRTKATLTGESLEDLLRRINVEQLTTGRVGVLADLPVAPVGSPATNPPATNGEATILPYLATYSAESIINWDEAEDAEGYRSLNLVVLDESGPERSDQFEWVDREKYRVLQLGDIQMNEAEGGGVRYMQGVFSDADNSSLDYDATKMVVPMYRGTPLEEIPFVFINTRDLLAIPDQAPLEGLARLVLVIYRGEADYRQALFMTGQDTLVVIGGTRNPDGTPGSDDAIRTGAGSRIDVEMNGDAKYIGVSSAGLSEMRQALENDKKLAAGKAGQLIEIKGGVESGEALDTRLAAQTASLNQLALTGAKGLELALKKVAIWIGADPEQCKVTPNMEFGETPLTFQDLGSLMSAKVQGLPLSTESIHALLRSKRLTNKEFDEEKELVDQEMAQMATRLTEPRGLPSDDQ